MGVFTLQAEQIAAGLEVRRIGRRVTVLAEAASTNQLALEAGASRANDGLAIFAEYQSAGRGRMGRSWHSPRAASILCSVLVFLDDTRLWPARTTLAGGLAVCEAISRVTPIEPGLRWPNDVLVGRRKLGGVLVESRPASGGQRAYVIGIGLNCLQQRGHFPAEIRTRATSLEIESPHPVDRLRLARALLTRLDAWLADPERFDDAALRDAWLARAVSLGDRVRLCEDGQEYLGRVIDLDPLAGLVVQLETGGRRLFDPQRTTVLDPADSATP